MTIANCELEFFSIWIRVLVLVNLTAGGDFGYTQLSPIGSFRHKQIAATNV